MLSFVLDVAQFTTTDHILLILDTIGIAVLILMAILSYWPRR